MLLEKDIVRKALIRERQELIALVKAVTPAQLKEQSLCSEWTHENVLSHILSFEMHWADALLLIFKLRSLNAITRRQSKRYVGKTSEEYVRSACFVTHRHGYLILNLY